MDTKTELDTDTLAKLRDLVRIHDVLIQQYTRVKADHERVQSFRNKFTDK